MSIIKWNCSLLTTRNTVIAKKSNREYTNAYVWSHFKNSLLTLSGVLIPSISSIMMMIADWPINLQLLNVLSLVAMVGISYWWHWFYKIDELAKEGSYEFMIKKSQEEKETIEKRYQNVDLKPYPIYHSMQIDLEHKFKTFNTALDKQQIISELSRKNFILKAQASFNLAISILAEIADILVVQNSVNIESIKQQHKKVLGEEKESLKNILEAYAHNEEKLSHLKRSLQSLIHSYVIATTHLASATSKTTLKEDIFGDSELEEAIESAKAVQEKLHSLTEGKNQQMKGIYMKYSNKGDIQNG